MPDTRLGQRDPPWIIGDQQALMLRPIATDGSG